MNLTNEILSRQIDSSLKISSSKDCIKIDQLSLSMKVPTGWRIAELSEFKQAIDSYEFPAQDELSKKDQSTYKQVIFPPVFQLKKLQHTLPISTNILCYCYTKSQLTGDHKMHIRSINKLEMMGATYLINTSGPYKNQPERLKIKTHDAAISKHRNFTYNTKQGTEPVECKLRTLSIDLDNWICCLYITETSDDEISEPEMESIIAGINTAANKCSCCTTPFNK